MAKVVEEHLWLVGGKGLVDKGTEVLVVAVLQLMEERKRGGRES